MADNKKLIILGALVVGVGALAFIYGAPAEAKPQLPPPSPGPRPPNPQPQAQQAPNPISNPIAAAIAAITALQQQAPQQPGNPTNPGGAGMPMSTAPSGLPLPNPAPLIQGQRYKARLELSGLEKLGSRDQIKSSFEDLGFSNVTVYMSQAELPSGWPPASLTNITGGSRWAEGTWNQSSQAVATPSQIQAAWTA